MLTTMTIENLYLARINHHPKLAITSVLTRPGLGSDQGLFQFLSRLHGIHDSIYKEGSQKNHDKMFNLVYFFMNLILEVTYYFP